MAIPAPVRGDLLAFGAGLLCGIGEDQKRAAFGVGVDRGDTHPWEGWGLAHPFIAPEHNRGCPIDKSEGVAKDRECDEHRRVARRLRTRTLGKAS